MIPPIKLDISDFVRQWNLTAEESDLFIYGVLDNIGAQFADAWRNEAGKTLKQTKQQYQRAIYIEKPDNNSLIVGLAGWLPNAVEQGVGPFDMKLGFKDSDKKHIKKGGGWWLSIPFRFATPEALGESTVFANIIPNQVYEVAKTILKDEKTSLSVTALPAQFRIKQTRPEVFNIKTKELFKAYEHKTSIYEGMRNVGAKGHSQYMTFRRVSDLSDPMAWIHTGIKSANLLERTLQDFPIDRIVYESKMEFLRTKRSMGNTLQF